MYVPHILPFIILFKCSLKINTVLYWLINTFLIVASSEWKSPIFKVFWSMMGFLRKNVTECRDLFEIFLIWTFRQKFS